MSDVFLRVAVAAPLREPLTYKVSKSDSGRFLRGTSVVVPLGKRQATGVVLEECSSPEDFPVEKIRLITDVCPDRPPLSSIYLKWLERISNYYVYPIGEVVDLAFAPLKKAGRKKLSNILPLSHTHQAPHLRLTPAQTQCLESIQSFSDFQVHLLFGVTGSGKTEVYLQLLEKTLAQKKRGLVLVPEISLTPQLISRFSSRFGDRIAVIHSHLTDRDRTNQWWSMVDGQKDILIGARSALFCPIPDLGIIVVDEEHEPSFKQEEKLKYHARDSAIMLAQTHDIPIVLGSATPSLESWQNALSGKFHLHKMPIRASNVDMPEVRIIDLRKEEPSFDDEEKGPLWATKELLEALSERLEKQEQVALFLNRRGLAQSVLCPGCGARKECPNCSIGLTLHAKTHLVCHYCDYHETLPEVCDICRDSELKSIGIGTELVESQLEKIFPTARLVRADRDEIQGRADLEELISKIEKREADVLIGTQMIAKGLDFPHLTLVGVLLADIALNLPDFRSAERSFQLLTQVSGRAGRHKTKGEVLIQTFNPDHPSIIYSKNHDYEGFATLELQNRQELLYPPFGRLVLIRLQGLDKNKTAAAAETVSKMLSTWTSSSEHSQEIEILGPTEAPIFKLRNKFRYQILVKASKKVSFTKLGWAILEQETLLPSGVRIMIDIDPINML